MFDSSINFGQAPIILVNTFCFVLAELFNIALIAEWLTSVMNSSMYTYEVSPVFSLCVIHIIFIDPSYSMEVRLLEKFRDMIGWKVMLVFW